MMKWQGSGLRNMQSDCMDKCVVGNKYERVLCVRSFSFNILKNIVIECEEWINFFKLKCK